MCHKRLSFFALISIECDLSHSDSVDIENFIENFKLYSNKFRKIQLYVQGLIELASTKFGIVSVIIVNVRLSIIVSNLNKYFNKTSKHYPHVHKTEHKVITVIRKSYASKRTNSNMKIKKMIYGGFL